MHHSSLSLCLSLKTKTCKAVTVKRKEQKRKMAGGISFARKAPSRLVPRDKTESSDRNKQICSRVGCGAKTSSTQVNHNQFPATSKLVTKSSSASLSNPKQSRLNPRNKLVQPDASAEASSSSSSNPHKRDVNRIMRTFDQGSSKKGASMSKYSFRNIKSNLGKKRTSEVECSASSTRGKEISRPQLDDRRSQTLHGGISISNRTRPTNNSTFSRNDDATSVGIQRSDARATRRLNEQDDELGQYSMNEIAEMLIALERLEQDEEQWLVMETNLFVSGLSFHDEHREMRLDIDNMSYEELLALEERMGNVSTALSEEAIQKCVQKIIYQGDDIRCSICQEEYKERNEAAKLRCEHIYHVECIKKWLSLKNWCPVCKAQVAPPLSSS